jgi:hypothetical protein
VGTKEMNNMEAKTIQHLNPIWRDKANYIIRVRINNDSHNGIKGWEQLWSRKIKDDLYEICCIPFFLYDIALGDEVKVDSDHFITEVKKRSGHFTFRVWFGDSKDSTIREHVIRETEKLGCLFEWYSTNLLAISAPTHDLAVKISGYLLQKSKLELLIYEPGQTKG